LIVKKTGQICWEIRPKTQEVKEICIKLVDESNEETYKLMKNQARQRMAIAERMGRFAQMTEKLLEVIPMSMLWSWAEGSNCWLVGMKSGIPGLEKMARWNPTTRPLVWKAKKTIEHHFKDYGTKIKIKQKW